MVHDAPRLPDQGGGALAWRPASPEYQREADRALLDEGEQTVERGAEELAWSRCLCRRVGGRRERQQEARDGVLGDFDEEVVPRAEVVVDETG